MAMASLSKSDLYTLALTSVPSLQLHSLFRRLAQRVIFNCVQNYYVDNSEKCTASVIATGASSGV
ncbi:hypothetical protein B0O99DRAFT_641953 [Bisporella sp. PMI_857]|nr:hypothetical protein B0O99DRAFT_641953 [Bisporella sp. PMI_857]